MSLENKILILIGLLILLILIRNGRKSKRKAPEGWRWNPQTNLYEYANNVKTPNGYEKKPYLTAMQWQLFRRAKYFANSRGYTVVPKVKLIDLINAPKENVQQIELMKLLIVDLLILDQNGNVKGLIQLDDPEKMQKHHQQANDFLVQAGYKVTVTKIIDEDLIKSLY